MTLPENVAGGQSGHLSHHNTLHDLYNEFDLATLKAAANGSVIKKSGGIWTSGTDLNSGASGFSDIGIRYVDYVNGVDTNNGLSPSTAMKTIQAAHDDLPASGTPTGGTIILSEGQHIANNVSITKFGTRIVGQGIWSTELLMNDTGYDTDCIRIDDAESCYIADLQISDRSNRASPVGEGRYGLYVDGGQESVFERIFFNGWADNYASTQGFTSSPTAIFIEGVSSFGDWMQLNQIRIRNANAGIKVKSGTNGWMNHVISGGARESLWVRRATEAVGNSVSWRFFECHWTGGGGGASDFSVFCDSTAGDNAGRVRFTSCQLEISAATGDTNGYYSDLTDTIFMGGHLGVATMGSGKFAIHLDSNAGGSVVGPYTEDGLGLPADFRNEAGAAWWQPSDYTGNYAP